MSQKNFKFSYIKHVTCLVSFNITWTGGKAGFLVL